MNQRALGNLRIMRAVEMVMSFDRPSFFPGTRDEDWAPYLSWLEPDAIDPATGDLRFVVQSYIVRTSHHNILIDTCVGNHKPRPTRPQWDMRTDDTYMQALRAHGLGPQDIDFVMCTHLHNDHIGWNTRLEDGRWVPTFPNARYLFAEGEIAAWRDVGHEKFGRAGYEDSVNPVLEAGQADIVRNDHALDDELWLESTPGHTPDHVAIRLASRGEDAVMCGDILHSPVQCLHPDWVPWPDWDPTLSCRTRRSFLERYADTSTLVCTAHFPLPSAGRLVSEGNAFRFVPEAATW